MKFYEAVKKQSIAILSILCFLVNISFGHKADPIDFRLRLKKGDTYTLNSKSTGESSSVRNGVSTSFTTEMSSDYLVTIEEVNDNGNTRSTFTLTGFALTMKAKGVTIDIDTRDSSKHIGLTGSAGKKALNTYNGAKKLIGMTFWVEYNERAEIIRMNLDTVFVQKLDYERMIGGNAKLIIQTVVFADYPVKIGNTWKSIGSQNKEGKATAGKSEYKLKSKKGTIAQISSASKGWGDVEDTNLTAKYTGEHKVDIPSGLPIEQHYKMEVNANKTTGSMKMKQDLTIRIVKN